MYLSIADGGLEAHQAPAEPGSLRVEPGSAIVPVRGQARRASDSAGAPKKM